MFTLLCCADLYGEKVNLELTWDYPPQSLSDVEAKIEEVFRQEARVLQPRSWDGGSGASPSSFVAARIQIYDDNLLCWADLAALSQLHEFDQLYVFQPQTPWHRDRQQDLPPPRPPTFSRPNAAIAANSFRTATRPSGNDDAYHSVADGHAEHHRAMASSAHDSNRVSPSPQTIARLEEQRREEDSLLEKLRRLRRERDALERQAMEEEELMRRRRAAEADARLRDKEEEIRAHREGLRRAEQDFQKLLDDKVAAYRLV